MKMYAYIALTSLAFSTSYVPIIKAEIVTEGPFAKGKEATQTFLSEHWGKGCIALGAGSAYAYALYKYGSTKVNSILAGVGMGFAAYLAANMMAKEGLIVASAQALEAPFTIGQTVVTPAGIAAAGIAGYLVWNSVYNYLDTSKTKQTLVTRQDF